MEDDIIEGFRIGPQCFIRLELGALLKLVPTGNAVEYVPQPQLFGDASVCAVFENPKLGWDLNLLATWPQLQYALMQVLSRCCTRL